MAQSFAGKGWSLEAHRTSLVLSRDDGVRRLSDDILDDLVVLRRRWRWHLVDGATGESLLRLRGLTRRRATALTGRIATWRFERDEVRALETLRARVEPEVAQVSAWFAGFTHALRDGEGHRRWVTRDEVEELVRARPSAPNLRELGAKPKAASLLTPAQRNAIRTVSTDLHEERRRANVLAEKELIERHRVFFETIESSPLTLEQAQAVVCCDNRVQVIAAAGSGKTSVMVARAAYALVTGLTTADRILLLAFNKDAAEELQRRIETRLRLQGLPTSGLQATTFHSYGLSLIGEATGAKPRLAPWLEDHDGVPMVARLVDELRDESPSFRYRWDLYRLLFARTSNSPEGAPAEWWDRETDVAGHRTLRGETVRSQGEKMIADWLYLNGVAYEYERAYSHPVADSEHSQYRPDFYYPDVDVWHEHWALGRDGRPPREFVGYAEGMEWKRRVHASHGTTLIETSWADIIDSSGFGPFEEDLRSHGVELDWNPDRPTPGAQPVEHEELARLVRSFMGHVKSNGFTRVDLETRLRSHGDTFSGYRSRLFLDLYWEVHDRWEQRLAAESLVDYEDMLVKASELLERRVATSRYDMVLVDEFQDSSSARARLVKALVEGKSSYLLTVGDDWQSIYRFAGSDVSVMTEFERIFGSSEQRRLQTTFRSTQVITDAASAFVSKNPRQIPKNVTSFHGAGGPPIRLASVTPEDGKRVDVELSWAVDAYLKHLDARIQSGEIVTGPGGRISVDVLGRYNAERRLLPRSWSPRLDVTFRTIHRAKGLEADYVLIPKAVDGTFGFPSRVENDPVLDLVMSRPDTYPFAEERRLMYVALTRARREVAILTVAGKESPFVVEMLKDGLIQPASAGAAAPTACPACGQGLLVAREGKFGAFLACARFPACRHTQKRQSSGVSPTTAGPPTQLSAGGPTE